MYLTHETSLFIVLLIMKPILYYFFARQKSLRKTRTSPAQRTRYGLLEGWISIIGNILIAAVKMLFGLLTKSVALIADAVHSLSDILSSGVVVGGFVIADKEADEEHPFGHGRFELVAGVIIAVFLMITAIEVFKTGIAHIQNALHPAAFSWLTIIFIAGTIIIKELMARFSMNLSVVLDSPSLKADAQHHRSDVLSTIVVLISMIATKFPIPFLAGVSIDGWAGILVALFIFNSGITILKENSSAIIGESPDHNTIQRIRKIACSYKNVHNAHDIIVNQYGSTRLISLHIEIPDTMNVVKAHDLSETIEDALNKKLNCSTVCHIDPISINHPHYKKVVALLQKLKDTDSRIYSFHDVRFIGGKKRYNIVFALTPDKGLKEKQYALLRKDIIAYIMKKIPNAHGIVIDIEPKFAF